MICTASVQESVPEVDGRAAARGWVTAEYGMLPASTGRPQAARRHQGPRRRPHGRDPAPDRPLAARRGRLRRRSASARSTSTATSCRPTAAPAARRSPAASSRSSSRSSGWSPRASSPAVPLTGTVAAVSCGIVDGVPLLDLDYPEDSSAEVDANVVMTGDGGLVEVQATAERTPLSRAHLDDLLALAEGGIARCARPRPPRPPPRDRRPRHAQRAQAARVRAPARRRRPRAAAGRRARPRGDRRRPSPTTR